jgi:hypothetical protein
MSGLTPPLLDVFMAFTGNVLPVLLCVVHSRAYEQYRKHSQLMHNTFVYLFIFFVHLLPDMFRQVPMPLSRGYIKITQDMHESDYKLLKLLKTN